MTPNKTAWVPDPNALSASSGFAPPAETVTHLWPRMRQRSRWITPGSIRRS